MKTLRIQVGREFPKGVYASVLTPDDMGFDDEVVLVKYSRHEPKRVCLAAARRLRALADAFERLAKMDNPMSYAAQKAALRQPPKTIVTEEP